MLHRPTRRAHVRADADAPEPKKGKHADRNLVLTTEFNYNYRVLDGVWASYVEKGAPPLLTPVLIEELLSPEHHPGVCAVGALYLYNTRYIVDTKMDYDRLIPECMIGKNFWVVSNKRLEITSARPSSAWVGVPAKVVERGRAKQKVSQPASALNCPEAGRDRSADRSCLLTCV